MAGGEESGRSKFRQNERARSTTFIGTEFTKTPKHALPENVSGEFLVVLLNLEGLWLGVTLARSADT
jgi:hypothetical protein